MEGEATTTARTTTRVLGRLLRKRLIRTALYYLPHAQQLPERSSAVLSAITRGPFVIVTVQHCVRATHLRLSDTRAESDGVSNPSAQFNNA